MAEGHEIQVSKEHYWETGCKSYSKKEIRKLLKEYFEIKKEFQPILIPYHQFFILEKNGI